MKLSILKVILWPKNTNHEPRIIEFKPGLINIITGENTTGKSSLVWIIDYCLGSEKCSIPVGLIRNVTGWFGLHLQLANTEMIVARRNPDDQQSTTDIFWDEGINLNIPDQVQKNARVDDLKNRLNQLSFLPSLDFSTSDTAGLGRPSCRDMAAFNFQPQHIIANPYTFFFKADTQEHRDKLRVIFPFVLGAIDADTLVMQKEYRDLVKERDQLQRELDARLTASRVWEAEIQSYYLQALNLGLLPNAAPAQPEWKLDNYTRELQRVPETIQSMDIPDIQEGASEAAVTQLTHLISEEDRLGQELGGIRRRLAKVDQLGASIDEYSSMLINQEDRIASVGWLSKKISDEHSCPVCSTNFTEENTGIKDLQSVAEEFSRLTTSVQSAPSKLDKEVADLRQQVRNLENEISRVRQVRKYVEGESAALSDQRQKVRQIYLFAGRVEQALENVSASSNVEETQRRINELSQRLYALRRQIDPARLRDRMEAARRTVSDRIADYARQLELEHANENVALNTRELTLEFHPLSGRTDFLWEVGSGKNWIGYHVAGLLSLHEHFLTIINNPVPRFLFIDQPSQVFFPDTWKQIDIPSPNQEIKVDEGSEETDSEMASLTDLDDSPDIQGVRKIFLALSAFMTGVRNEFQIIVTEHAGSITWSDIPHIHVVGNWRKGHDEFLIPEAWLQE